MMTAIILKRTGDAPLSFEGEALATVDGFRQGGREQTRWHEIAVYETAGANHVVSIGYRTRWQGELDHDFATRLASPADLLDALHSYDLLGPVRGYPPGGQYAEKQRRLEDDLRRRYEALITELYDALPTGWGAEKVE